MAQPINTLTDARKRLGPTNKAFGKFANELDRLGVSYDQDTVVDPAEFATQSEALRKTAGRAQDPEKTILLDAIDPLVQLATDKAKLLGTIILDRISIEKNTGPGGLISLNQIITLPQPASDQEIEAAITKTVENMERMVTLDILTRTDMDTNYKPFIDQMRTDALAQANAGLPGGAGVAQSVFNVFGSGGAPAAAASPVAAPGTPPPAASPFGTPPPAASPSGTPPVAPVATPVTPPPAASPFGTPPPAASPVATPVTPPPANPFGTPQSAAPVPANVPPPLPFGSGSPVLAPPAASPVGTPAAPGNSPPPLPFGSGAPIAGATPVAPASPVAANPAATPSASPWQAIAGSFQAKPPGQAAWNVVGNLIQGAVAGGGLAWLAPIVWNYSSVMPAFWTGLIGVAGLKTLNYFTNGKFGSALAAAPGAVWKKIRP